MGGMGGQYNIVISDDGNLVPMVVEDIKEEYGLKNYGSASTVVPYCYMTVRTVRYSVEVHVTWQHS